MIKTVTSLYNHIKLITESAIYKDGNYTHNTAENNDRCPIAVFTALNRMQTRSSDENSVRPIVTKRKKDLSGFL